MIPRGKMSEASERIARPRSRRRHKAKRKPRGPNVGGGDATTSQRGQIGKPRCQMRWPGVVTTTAGSTRVAWQCRKQAKVLDACDECRLAVALGAKPVPA